ncbi:MAG: hypothetical protein ACJ8AI_28265 [Rhodopila sp.]
MTHDRLQLLLSIRRQAADDAMKALAERIAAEQEAGRRLAVLDAAAAAERLAAGRPKDGLPDLEGFARWSSWARARRREALAALVRAETCTALARTALTEARAAARVVEELIAARAADAHAHAARREAHALDDMASRQHRDRRLRASSS